MFKDIAHTPPASCICNMLLLRQGCQNTFMLQPSFDIEEKASGIAEIAALMSLSH